MYNHLDHGRAVASVGREALDRMDGVFVEGEPHYRNGLTLNDMFLAETIVRFVNR